MIELFDDKFSKRVFPEIDIKYVKAFDVFLQKQECKGIHEKYKILLIGFLQIHC